MMMRKNHMKEAEPVYVCKGESNMAIPSAI